MVDLFVQHQRSVLAALEKARQEKNLREIEKLEAIVRTWVKMPPDALSKET